MTVRNFTLHRYLPSFCLIRYHQSLNYFTIPTSSLYLDDWSASITFLAQTWHEWVQLVRFSDLMSLTRLVLAARLVSTLFAAHYLFNGRSRILHLTY